MGHRKLCKYVGSYCAPYSGQVKGVCCFVSTVKVRSSAFLVEAFPIWSIPYFAIVWHLSTGVFLELTMLGVYQATSWRSEACATKRDESWATIGFLDQHLPLTNPTCIHNYAFFNLQRNLILPMVKLLASNVQRWKKQQEKRGETTKKKIWSVHAKAKVFCKSIHKGRITQNQKSESLMAGEMWLGNRDAALAIELYVWN